MESIHDESYKGYRIDIIPDISANNPRDEFDHLGTITMSDVPRRLIDPTEKDAIRLPEARGYRRGPVMQRYLRLFCDVAVALPIRYEDHGSNGAKFSTWTGMDDPDGFIYVTRETMRHEYGTTATTPQALDQARICLAGEVDEYNAWCNGEVYGYQITVEDIDDRDPILDSCWGYYGLDDALSAAREIINDIVKPLEGVSA